MQVKKAILGCLLLLVVCSLPGMLRSAGVPTQLTATLEQRVEVLEMKVSQLSKQLELLRCPEALQHLLQNALKERKRLHSIVLAEKKREAELEQKVNTKATRQRLKTLKEEARFHERLRLRRRGF